jgi:hypothetical protein
MMRKMKLWNSNARRCQKLLAGLCFGLWGLLASQGALASSVDLEDIQGAVRWASQDGGFWEAQKYVSGDYNGDGTTDVARVYGTVWGETNIDTFLSNGEGFTSARWANSVGSFSEDQHYLAADFDGDGDDDIARIWNHFGLTSVDVLLSSGSDFIFSSWLLQSGDFNDTMHWEVGDFNGDGLADVARIFDDSHETSIDILVSNGQDFVPQRWTTQGGGHWPGMHFVAGDFTGDGATDVAKIFRHGGKVSIDLFRSAGSSFLPFEGAARLLGSWGNDPSFHSGDWDGDGIADFAQLDGAEGGLEASVFLFDGTAFGGFTLFDATSRSSRYTVGDYDGDGKTEIVGIDGRFLVTDLEVFGGPTPAWEYEAQAVRWQTGSGVYTDDQVYLAGDFNGDGAPDMARVFNEYGETSVDVHSNTGVGFEYTRWATKQGAHGLDQIFLTGDVNGDGIDDILKIFAYAGATTADVFLGGTTGFTYHRWLTSQGAHWPGQKFVAGDFNGDGLADFAKIWDWDGLATIDVFLSAGTHFSSFTYWAIRDGGFWPMQQYVAGDYTGDGRDDIARIFTHAGLTSIDVFSSQGTSFSQQRWITQNGRGADGQKHVSGDFDGDGLEDLVKVGANPASRVAMRIFTSQGSSFEGDHFLEEETGFVTQLKVAAADFDLDGRVEVATAYRTQGSLDTHFDVYGGDFSLLPDPSFISSPGDSYPYDILDVQSNLSAQGFTLHATDHLDSGQCTIVYPNTDHTGPSKDLGVMACAYADSTGETHVEWNPVYGGCDVALGGGECEFGIFKKTLTVNLGGAPVELQIKGPRARACGSVSPGAVCAKTTATLWEGSFLITDGNGNGGGVGAFAGIGAATRARYQDGVLSGDVAIGVGPGVRIKYSVNLLSAVGVGEAGFSYSQEGVDAAVDLSGDVIETIDDAITNVAGTIGDWISGIPTNPCDYLFFC